MIIIGYDEAKISHGVADKMWDLIERLTGIQVLVISLVDPPTDIRFWDLDRLPSPSTGAIQEMASVLNLKHVPPGFHIEADRPPAGDSWLDDCPGCLICGGVRFLGSQLNRLQQFVLQVFQKVLGLFARGNQSKAVSADPGRTGLQAGRGDD